MLTKKPETAVTAKEYYECSFYFFNASIRCWKVETNTNGVAKSLFVAAMANAALACELAIKAIYLKINKKRIKGHDLYELISKLPDNEIGIIFEKLKSSSYIDAENKLKEYSGAFTEWRYLFEYESCFSFSPHFLLDLYNVLELIYKKKCAE